MVGLGVDLGLTGLVAIGQNNEANIAYDYYVDGENGNDADDGLTAATAFQTLSKMETVLNALPADSSINVLIKSATYPYNGGANTWENTNLASGVLAKIFYEENSVFLGPNDGITDDSWLNPNGGNVYTFEHIGLGPSKGPNQPRVTGFDAGTGNGLGCNMSGGARCIVRNFQVDDCVDGWSMHGANSNMDLYDCVISGCSKAAIVHIHSGGQARAFDCDFLGATGATLGIGWLGGEAGSTQALYDGCTFSPATAAQTLELRRTDLTDCVLGTYSERVTVSSVEPGTITNSFVHLYVDGDEDVSFDTCWGFLTCRHRNGGSITANHCHFSTGTVSSALVHSNYDPGSGSPMVFTNCIVRDFGTAFGEGMNSVRAAQWIDAGSGVTYCCLFNNVADFDAALAGDDGFAAAVHDNIGSNPDTGDRSTVSRSDWALSATSPLIGAGSGGSDIGFQ